MLSGFSLPDVNECLYGPADCSPWADCENIFGSFTCTCFSGYTDADPSRPGRTCQGTIGACLALPCTSVSPSTTAWTVTPVIQASAPIVSHTEAISVECRLGFITVSVARDFLQLRHISEASLYLGQPMCGQSDGNSTHVKLTMAWNDCGALVFQVRLPHEDVAPTVQLEVPIICTYVKRITISTGNDLTGFVALVGDAVMGIGTFPVTVRLLNGTSPLPQNYTLSPKDEVIIEVRVNSTVPQIKVVINKCWANPTANPSTTPVGCLSLIPSCPVPDSYTTVLQNGNSTTSLVAVNIFSLVDLSVIFLHCQIQICIETPLATCRAVRCTLTVLLVALSLYC
uniref:Uromodulin-like 1 n=1 Tax=Electrophorus electricus TaxID=8005 RepID=A0A4W4FXC0_ELEEL